MDKNELYDSKQEFITLLKSTTLEDVDDIVKDLDDLGFFTAPAAASAKNHGSFEGGLMIHSLNVYYAAKRLKEAFAPVRPDVFEKVSDESIIIASLLHDVCKADTYFVRRNSRREMGESEYGYAVSPLPLGHGEKSVAMLLKMGVGLTDAEMCAIRWHMGAWSVNSPDDNDAFRAAVKLYPLVSIIQMADTLAAHVYERAPQAINS